ncbi:MAG: DUF4339 domain-containing protein [Pirellulales bacterium]|nr:DUF4339 domain-containing protein [Pirellulales bacterium]
MNPIEWFYAKGDKHSGPVNSVELKRMATAGELEPGDLVWREGMAEWTIARNVRGLFEEEIKSAGQSAGAPPKLAEPVPMPPAAAAAAPAAFATAAPQAQKIPQPSKHLFDLLLDFVRSQFTASFVESTTRRLVTVGKFGLYAAMGLTLLFWLLLAMKTHEYVNILIGIISFLVLAVLQYIGSRFCEASERLNRNTSATLSSTVFLDCFALFNIVIGATALLGSLAAGIPAKEAWWIITGLASFIISQYLAFIALNPSTIHVNIVSEQRAGEEALGLISFLVKSQLKLVSVVFGIIAIAGSLMLLDAGIELFTTNPLIAARIASFAITALVTAAALPLVAYLIFLSIYLLLDTLRAILVLPDKLEKSENREEK